MRIAHVLVAALASASLFSSLGNAAPALDAAGKCRDNGKFVAQSQCQTTPAAGRCRNVTTKKFAKCGTPNTEPVPSTAAGGGK